MVPHRGYRPGDDLRRRVVAAHGVDGDRQRLPVVRELLLAGAQGAADRALDRGLAQSRMRPSLSPPHMRGIAGTAGAARVTVASLRRTGNHERNPNVSKWGALGYPIGG